MVLRWLSVCLSIHLSYIRPYCCFRMITWINVNGFSPNLVSALILWRSVLGLLIRKFCQFWADLSVRDKSIFSFLDDNFSKYQWIFTKFDMCIDIVEICFGVAHWQILSIFHRVICPRHDDSRVLSFHVLFINFNWVNTPKTAYLSTVLNIWFYGELEKIIPELSPVTPP